MPASASSFRLLLATYTAAIFVSAALLFAVQPLFAKMVLPKLGGTPAVWSVAMVFFQAMLLAGYAYAHALTKLRAGPDLGRVHLVVTIGCDLRAAARDRRRLGPPAGRGPGILAARPVRRFDRAAVFRAVGERPAAAGLVCAHRPSAGQGPVFPLCREQCRQLPRAARLSVRDRAVHASAAADLRLDRRLLCPDRTDRALRRLSPALARRAAGYRDRRRRAADLARRADLDRARGGAVRAADRHHRAYLDRCRRGAVPVGGAARALSRDLRDRVPVAPDPAAPAGSRSSRRSP